MKQDSHLSAIEFKAVNKLFLAGANYYPSLRDWISQLFSRDFFKGKESFYALKDVSFEIKQGEAVGLVGHNGAGKSTILKIISRVVKQTSGQVRVTGSVAGLLELGAGFHPELNGRENIFFQGTILGMSREEINEKTPEIIEFSGLGNFIDSPVKHYSSGMYARLGFSVAIHLNPEILLIDEVLAVGDVQFKAKCMERIHQFCADKSKTVIIVSHSDNMIAHLTNRVIWLESGKIIEDGETKRVLEAYERAGA